MTAGRGSGTVTRAGIFGGVVFQMIGRRRARPEEFGPGQLKERFQLPARTGLIEIPQTRVLQGDAFLQCASVRAKANQRFEKGV